MLSWRTDVVEAQWLQERIRGFAQTIGSVVPHGFESYARILHPLEGLDVSRWADLADRNGRKVHAGMHYESIARPPGGHVDPHEYLNHMAVGTLPEPQLRALVDIVARHTDLAQDCWFAIWEGYGHLHGGSGVFDPAGIAPPEALDGPRVVLPNRSYLLLSGQLGDIHDAYAMLGRSPNLWWPNDRSWCTATEIDFGWTYLGGPEPLIADVLTTDALETLRCQATDDLGPDLINRALDQADGGADTTS